MVIESPHNETLKTIRRLKRCKGDQALLEGPHLVVEALASGIRLESVLMTPEMRRSPVGRPIESHLPFPPLEVRPSLLDKMADADSPRGLLAVAELPRGSVEVLPLDRSGAFLYLDRIQDPGNLGALARVAEAAGASGLALSPETVHPNHPRALRASAGSLLRLPVARNVEVAQLRERLAPLEPRWFALATRGGTDLYRAPAASTGVLLLGSEGQGLSPEVQAACDIALTIPLESPVESLNVTVAAALTLFEWRRRRLHS
ncbi:MAG: RNA methyltransferase [Acidobacteria bacterium]|nr:RNA methyltransferase [Acidobacteriota bacterium]